MNHGALANLDHDEAINEIASGVMLKEIAARYKVSKVAVYKRLKDHPDYKDAIALQADSFVQDAMQEVRTCDADTVNIARARVDAAFKYAKAHNKDYADKAELTHRLPDGPMLQINVSSPQQNIDGAVRFDHNPALEHDGDA